MEKKYVQSFKNLLPNIVISLIGIFLGVSFFFLPIDNNQEILKVIVILLSSLIFIFGLFGLLKFIYFIKYKDNKLILGNVFKNINIIDIETIKEITIENLPVTYLGRSYQTDWFIVVYYNDNNVYKYGGYNKNGLPIQLYCRQDIVEYLDKITNYKFKLKDQFNK